jgi:short subunit fatty acids transporter
MLKPLGTDDIVKTVVQLVLPVKKSLFSAMTIIYDCKLVIYKLFIVYVLDKHFIFNNYSY